MSNVRINVNDLINFICTSNSRSKVLTIAILMVRKDSPVYDLPPNSDLSSAINALKSIAGPVKMLLDSDEVFSHEKVFTDIVVQRAKINLLRTLTLIDSYHVNSLQFTTRNYGESLILQDLIA